MGRLLEIQNWIASGNSLCVPAELKTTPLKVALDTGFHSLVELLVRNEESQDVKNRALQQAVSLKRLDLIELLVSHGSEVSSVPFIEVLYVWDPQIIRYFLDHGADFITGFPFALAFREKIRTALRPWRECRANHPDLAPQLQKQADRALRHFCFEGDLKWMSLLMWAGADPRSRGPMFDYDEDDADGYTTALDAATYCDNVQILKRLKPDARRDDINTLLRNAAGGGRASLVEYLLELGANPNDKPNGGSSAVDDCLRGFRYEAPINFYQTDFGRRSKASKYKVAERLKTVQLLLEQRALWRPDDKQQLIEEEKRREEAHRQWILRDLIRRYDRQKIYDEIWSEPIQHVAKRYGMSDVGFAKICKKLRVPRPGLGYWAKKAAGKPLPKQPALPELLTHDNQPSIRP